MGYDQGGRELDHAASAALVGNHNNTTRVHDMDTLTIISDATANIHSIASQQVDREIKFRKGTKYAVVLASYYGGKGYTTHATQLAASNKADKLLAEGYSVCVIDSDGVRYIADSFDGEMFLATCDEYRCGAGDHT